MASKLELNDTTPAPPSGKVNVRWQYDVSGNVSAYVDPSGGGGGGTYISALIPGPDTTKTITGATHGLGTPALLVVVYDNASPRNAIGVGWTVDASTYDVVITFAVAQSNYYVVIK